MSKLGELTKTADWKNEKHAPVIEAPEKVEADKPFQVTLTVGKEIPHPNTTEHHIAWLSLYFKPKTKNVVHHVAHIDLKTHGESTEGPNKGPSYACPSVTLTIKLKESGTLIATSYCNIHGVWESTKEIEVG